MMTWADVVTQMVDDASTLEEYHKIAKGLEGTIIVHEWALYSYWKSGMRIASLMSGKEAPLLDWPRSSP